MGVVEGVSRAPAIWGVGVSVVGGAICYLLQTPLPWMIGPLLAMALLKFAGLDLRAPRGGREAGQIVIASALGLYFTPTVAGEVVDAGFILVAAALFAVALSYVGAFFISRFAGTDRTTAYFSSVPGGATEMAILAERFGARPDRVAVAQSLRILMVVTIVPFAFAAWGVHGTDVFQQVDVPVSGQGLAMLIACTAVGGLAFQTIRAPNAWMLGPLFVSIGLTASGVQWSSMPTVLTNAAQVMMGCALGSRFEREFIRRAPRFVAVVVASILISIIVSASFGVGLAYLSGLIIPTMVLATAPGGITEMCITAKVLRLGVPLVTAAHVTRVIIMVTTTAPMFRLVRHAWRRVMPHRKKD